MAKREISSTLKNLKFMQRAAQKDEKPKKEEEVIPSGDFPASIPVRKCVVIVEGDPLPGATTGRMSFLNFNPSVAKLNKEESSPSETESAATSSGRQNDATPVRENGSSQDMLDGSELDASSNDGNLKKRRTEAAPPLEHPSKSRKNDEDNQDSSSGRSRSSKKREKLDWNVLRPPKYQNRRS